MKKHPQTCYYCSAVATTREHVPPKSFFPKATGANLQLLTVPSCAEHNNGKSQDDQYLLTHICLNASKGPSLARDVFLRSIMPQLERSAKFKSLIMKDSEHFNDGTAIYQVDTRRFDSFFDHLCRALFFNRYGTHFSPETHKMTHIYPTLHTEDSEEVGVRDLVSTFVEGFRTKHSHLFSHYEAAKIDQSVYANEILDPGGRSMSITIVHTFYGLFEAVSMLSRKWSHVDA